MYDIVGKRYYWFLLSLLVIVPGVFSLATHGLKLSIDFTGGTIWELQMSKAVPTDGVRAILADNGYGDSLIQTSSNNTLIIRMKELNEGSAVKTKIMNQLEKQYGSVKELELQSIGPSLGTQIANRALLAILLASIGILIYIAYAFRNTQNPFLYGIAALIAMVHDVLVVVGIFSILGWVRGTEVDSLFVTAVLTVIGFSVHDTIVVFDRIRENLNRPGGRDYEETVNYSVLQTLVRSLNTSLTVIFTLAALYLFGGDSTKDFVLALLIGIASGTYSSIFNASQVLVVWENREVQHFWARVRGKRPRRSLA